jgi:HlyD family secretion protein
LNIEKILRVDVKLRERVLRLVLLVDAAKPGETVAPAIFGGTSTRGSVVTIVDPNTLEVEADINESSIGKITPGLTAEVTLDALPNEKLPAEVRKIIPTADRQKATVKVKVRFLEIDPRILPDMNAKVTFIQKPEAGAKTEASRVTIPKSALQQRDGKTVVFIFNDGRAVSQAVTAGGEFGDRVEIKQGLAGGETIIVRGSHRDRFSRPTGQVLCYLAPSLIPFSQAIAAITVVW